VRSRNQGEKQSTIKLSIALLAVGFAASLGFADSASAAKKLTYDPAGGLQCQGGQSRHSRDWPADE
jgi:hypothetical protein